MDDDHRRLLNRHRPELVRDIANVEPLLDFLVSSDVFTANDDDIQDIRAQETPLERAAKLLDLLQTRGPDAYECFLHALRYVRPHLAKLLEQSEGSKRPALPAELTDAITSATTQPNTEETVRKLQKALRGHYRELARSTTLLDHQTLAEPVGLDEVFVTLSALKFDEVRSLFAKEKKLTPKKIQELASKAWSDRRSGEEITELSRLLRLESGRSARSCLLLGHAASGKTLTLYKILCLWAEGSEELTFLNEFEFVFYVSCRDERAMKGKHAWDVLRLDQFAISGLDKTQEKQLATYLEDHSQKVLILFDGVDEGGEKWANSKGIHQILRRKALGQCSFVVTGRPCLKAYEMIPRCVQHFHLVGLNDYHLEELLKRRLGDEGQALCEELKKAEWTKLRVLMKETPLLANMVAVLVKDGLSLPKTSTEVYTTMLLNLVSRSQVKTDSTLPTSRKLSALPEEVKESLRQVGVIAVNGLRKGQFVFDEKDVIAVCGDAAQRLGLVEEFRTVSVSGDRHEVRFCHLTWQEYLAAYCVSQAEEVEKELLICQQTIGVGEETFPFWRFVAGLLDIQKLQVLMGVLSRRMTHGHGSWSWLLFKMSCLEEAVQQPCASAEEEETKRSAGQAAAAVSLPEKVDFTSCVLSFSEVHSVSVALSYAPHVAVVDISHCNLQLAHLQILRATCGLQHVERLYCSGNNLHGDSLVELTKGLQSNERVQLLGLGFCNLDESDCHILGQILNIYNRKSLQDVSLEDNPIGTNGHNILWPAVHASKLRWLSLSQTVHVAAGSPDRQSYDTVQFGEHMHSVFMNDNHLSTENAESVVRAAQNASCLSILDLSRNRIDSRIVNVLAAVYTERAQQASTAQRRDLRHETMTVRLHDNEVGRKALEWLAKKMPVGSGDSVECGMLVVSGGQISLRDLSMYFDKYMQKGGKGDLVLHLTGLDASGAQQVARKLTDEQVPVEALGLGWNSLGDEGVLYLASALSTNSRLRALSLWDNKVGSVGFMELTNILIESNRTLQLLEIGGNPIFASNNEKCSAGARHHLGKLLTVSCGLKVISLCQTGLGDEECQEIGDALVKNTNDIRLLDMGRNEITDAGVTALCRGLEKNTRVRFVNLSGNAVGSEGLSAVYQCVEIRSRSSHPLERVWIGDVSGDVGQCTRIVTKSSFDYSSLTSCLDTYCSS